MALAMTLMATEQQHTSLAGARGGDYEDHARLVSPPEETGEEAKLKKSGTKKRGDNSLGIFRHATESHSQVDALLSLRCCQDNPSRCKDMA